jgi:TusA-related sulfurtransferase
MSRLLDISHDVCPMTTVKVGMALSRLAPAEQLEVRVSEEALKNVVASVKADGHRIASADRRAQGFLLVVEKGGAATGGSAAGGITSAAQKGNEEVQP